MIRAIALAGGGSFGSMEVGAVRELLDAGRHWTIQTGVSAGALNVAYLGQAQTASELPEWAAKLEEEWLKIHTKDVYKYCFGLANLLNSELIGWLGSLLVGQESVYKLVYDLEGKIDANLLASSALYTGVGFVDFVDGQYLLWSNREPAETLVPAVRASIAIPVTFPPSRFPKYSRFPPGGRDVVGLDGGVVEGTPALDAMRVLWSTDEEAELYIVVPSTEPANYLSPRLVNGLTGETLVPRSVRVRAPDLPIDLPGWPKIAARAIGLMSRAVHVDDVRVALLLNQLRGAMGLSAPSVRLIFPEKLHGSGLEWDPEAARLNIEEGRKAARRLMDVPVELEPE